MSTQQPRESKEVLEGKIFAFLGYLSILCIIPLVLKKDNNFALFHAKQGLVVFVIEVAVFILHVILGVMVLRWGWLICGIYSFIGLISSLRGEMVKLFLISDIAEKITL